MNVIRIAAGGVARAIGTISPASGSAMAMPLFTAVAKPRPVSTRDQPTMWRARRSTLRIAGVDRRGVDVCVYEWGTGPRTVAVLHGWDGRTSQFAALTRELVAEGYRVVAFDAPAHGASGGRRTYLVDWIDALTALRGRHGAFAGVIGHSFGGLAALVAVAGGLSAERVVTVAAPADAEALLSQFTAAMRYSDSVADAMAARFARRYFAGDPDPFAWLSAIRRPLPAGIPLLVIHDGGDRTVPASEADRILAAHPGALSLRTRDLGHNRILRADEVLDAVPAFLGASTTPSDDERPRDGAAPHAERASILAAPEFVTG